MNKPEDLPHYLAERGILEKLAEAIGGVRIERWNGNSWEEIAIADLPKDKPIMIKISEVKSGGKEINVRLLR